jgi:hypothetical protein
MKNEEKCMAFKDIEIIDFDTDGIEQIAGTENRVKVPYILSETPSKEWRHYFETRWPDPQQPANVVDDQVRVPCRMDETAIRKDGDCWNLVATQVEDANQHCREIDARRQPERDRKEEIRRQEEKKRSDFEEWKRNLRRRH